MIVAFNKNELKDGTKRKLSEYSDDLETRVKNEFDKLEIIDFTDECTASSLIGGFEAVQFGKLVVITFNFDATNTSAWVQDLIVVPEKYKGKRTVVPGKVIFFTGADTGKRVQVMLNNKNSIWYRALDTSPGVYGQVIYTI